MARVSRETRKEAYVSKARAELEGLSRRGVRMGGNCYSQVLLVKSAEKDGSEPFSGRDGEALRASLSRLGYAPEDWEWLLTTGDDGSTLAPELLVEALAALDPATVILTDEAAAAAFREAYPEELASQPEISKAMLAPGSAVHVRGMRVAALGDFDAMLDNAHAKQKAWSWIKRLAPLAEPY